MKKKIIKLLDKEYNSKISCLTCYSSSVTSILDGNVDIILIGDSLGSTLYGFKNKYLKNFSTPINLKPNNLYIVRIELKDGIKTFKILSN